MKDKLAEALMNAAVLTAAVFFLCIFSMEHLDNIQRWSYPLLSYMMQTDDSREQDGIKTAVNKVVTWQMPLLRYFDQEAPEQTKVVDPAYEQYKASLLEEGISPEDQEAIMEQYAGANTENPPEETAAETETQQQTDLASNETEAPPEPETEAPVQAASNITGNVYSAEQLNDLNFLTGTLYKFHGDTSVTQELLNGDTLGGMDLKVTSSADAPQILIYHTHASEYFLDSDTNDPNTLVPGVGEYLAQLLREQYGFNVIHDWTLFPYNSSYSDAYQHIMPILEAYPSIEVVIDLHRDDDGGKKRVVDVNGKPTAQIMFFNGISRDKKGPLSDRPNSNLTENLAFSFQMKIAAEAYYPGFTMRNYLRPYRYNLHVMGTASLIEIGGQTNTVQEAKNAMEPLADILNKVLHGE